MAKRTATSDLNHDNWDREDEPEEAGSFAKASEDTLKKRVIKVAKRRNPISTSEEGQSNAFGGFSGFGNKAPVPITAPGTFGFLSKLTNKTDSKSNGTTDKESTEKDKNQEEYYAKLKGLNEGVAEWIKKHVGSNPFVNLQPIFKDYEKYFNDLEKLKSETSEKTSIPTTSSPPSTTSVPSWSFGTTSASSAKFSFGVGSNTGPGYAFGSSTANTMTFSSASSSSTLTLSDGSFSSKSPFSFGNASSDSGKFSFTSTVVKPADEPKSEEADAEDEPPKTEFTPVVEEGHIYSTRCKVFVKKDGNFADHGVGTLYLKPVPDSEKVQLIVRNDTNLGKLLCNFILSEGIPTKRMGKKDVMLVCIPTPEIKPPPVPILLRVKSTEDADELLKVLEKHKK